MYRGHIILLACSLTTTPLDPFLFWKLFPCYSISMVIMETAMLHLATLCLSHRWMIQGSFLFDSLGYWNENWEREVSFSPGGWNTGSAKWSDIGGYVLSSGLKCRHGGMKQIHKDNLMWNQRGRTYSWVFFMPLTLILDLWSMYLSLGFHNIIVFV